MSWLKKRLPARRWKRVLVYIASVLLILLALDVVLTQYWRRIEVGHETTRITSPLNRLGYPDYVAALDAMAAEGVTAENNAALGLLKVVGTERANWNPAAMQRWREQVLGALGLPTTPMPSMLTTYDDWAKEHPATASATGGGTMPAGAANAGEEEAMFKRPWKAAEHPRWAKWLEAQQPALAEAHRALERPRLYVPYRLPEGHTLVAILLPTLQPWRDLARTLVADAMNAAGEGDFARCKRDLSHADHLARLVGDRPLLIECLVGIGMEASVQRGIQGAAAAGVFSAEQYRELLKMVDGQGAFASPARAMDTGERFMVLDVICGLAAHGLGGGEFEVGGAARGGWAFRTFVPLNYNKLLRVSNEHFDQLAAAYRAPDHLSRQKLLKAVEMDLIKRRGEGTMSRLLHPAETLLAHLLPALSRVSQAEEALRMERELSRVALALRLHKAGQGAFPETLEELAPGLLPEVPTDGFSGGALRYRKEGEGYLLYSVGRDEKDDGGKTDASGRGNLDMVVRAER